MKKRLLAAVGIALFAALLVGCSFKPYADTSNPRPQIAVRYKDLSFLTEEQQEIYERAMILYPSMEYSTENWQLATNGQGYLTREIDGVEYHRLSGKYETWEEFKALWLSTFTESWFEAENEYYREEDGYTWVLVGAKSGPWTASETYYEVGYVREDMIVFYVNALYDDGIDKDVPMWQEYHMVQFVAVEDGWRCNIFSM